MSFLLFTPACAEIYHSHTWLVCGYIYMFVILLSFTYRCLDLYSLSIIRCTRT
ncbi:hypothetical protein BJX64DRAFT_253804 [Aspergillus heterothallicus]